MRLYFTLFIAVIISLLFAFSCSQQISPNQHSVSEIDAAKLRIAQLESFLEETKQIVDSKTFYLRERDKLIEDSERQIRDLESDLSSFKNALPSVHERIIELEEEVKLLWAALRRCNFDLHILKAKAMEAEDRVEVASSEVQKMSDFVTDQWIRIQHLEQMIEFNARRHSKPQRCTFLKLINDIRRKHLPKVYETLGVCLKERKPFLEHYLSQIMLQLRAFWAAVTMYHHQLQGFIKHGMERNEMTAVLANREVVFFMASALITFPVLGAWMLLSS